MDQPLKRTRFERQTRSIYIADVNIQILDLDECGVPEPCDIHWNGRIKGRFSLESMFVGGTVAE